MMRLRAILVLTCLLQGGCVTVEHDRNPDLTPLSTSLPNAEQGDPQAQYRLGLALNQSWGRPLVKDGDAGLRYLLAAAEQGNPQAQVALANMYLNGVPDSVLNRTESTVLGKYWLQRAARGGTRDAYFTLANWNMNRRTPPMDPLESCKWHWLAWHNCTDKTLTAEQIDTARAQADAWTASVSSKH